MIIWDYPVTNDRGQGQNILRVMLDIQRHVKEIEYLCRSYKISRFELFGSALSDEFSPESDIDCVIDFVEDGGNYFERYFDFKAGLEGLFGRSVDVVVGKAIRNPYFRASIDASRRLVYAA